MGTALSRARQNYIDCLCFQGRSAKVLLVGEGNGSFLVPFLRRYPQARVTVVDESPEMLAVARKRCEASGLDCSQVVFKVIDLLAVPLPAGPYDLIVTHFFFDNFAESDVSHLVQLIAAESTQQAQWLVADFYMPRSGWRSLRARVWLSFLYLFFAKIAEVPVSQLPEVGGYLKKAGFYCLDRQLSCAQMLQSSHYIRHAN